ncbi:DNA recombinational repair protein BRCA2 [Ceratobasidium sp. AG-Ba]|nr:DNA recombinational repair protein BRCA2 [Ceratobasidium sp. AG-Ba]QRW09219.1 DNA recombinational repair protein BRCA2 [Ceratobasidium sp. AG-Ba]
MSTPTRKGARKRPRLSDEQLTQEEQHVAQGDSFSEFFGSEIDFDDEALQMVDKYDVFQPDITCVANSGDGQFLDGPGTRGEEDENEDEVPSSQGEADAGEPYTIGTIHGEYPSSSQCSVPNGSPSRRPPPFNKSPPALLSLDEPPRKDEYIDFGAYVPIPAAVGFASTSAVLDDPDMPTFMPASQVPIDRSELGSSVTRPKPKSSIKLAGGGAALKPISVDDIKASAQKLMNYQQDTRWKPQTRLRKMPPPMIPARQVNKLSPLPERSEESTVQAVKLGSTAPSPAPPVEDETEEDIDFGSLITSSFEIPSTSVDMSYEGAMPTFMPASQVPIDRSELPSSSVSSKSTRKLDIKLAGGSGALMPLTEEQIKASAEKLMAYQKDTKWKPQARTRLPQAGPSSRNIYESHNAELAASPGEADVNDSGVELLEPTVHTESEIILDSKAKGKQREVTPPSALRSILRPMENLDDDRPSASHSVVESAEATAESDTIPEATPKNLDNPFSSTTQMKRTTVHPSTTSFKTPVRPSLVSRYPLDSASNPPVQSPLFSSSQNPLLSQTTPSTLYRLGLSQRKPKSKASVFTTPFKPGMAPGEKGREMLDARNKATPSRINRQNLMSIPTRIDTPLGTSRASAGISGIARALEAEKERQAMENAVFDTRRVPGRKGLREAGVTPPTDSKKQAITKELSIPYLTLKAASDFSFPQGGHIAAFNMLQERGCGFVTQEWVRNHWGQVVWKLAGIARTGAEVAKGKWSWEEASMQMLYRYEREINRAQRPAIRLIQERDASAALALVLCVSDIQMRNDEEAEFELTDGWYKIRALPDKVLSRAVRRGKLVVGRKIAVAGARLEGGNEGKEVLKAYYSSALKIGGNSTSLAPWDARLGFQPRPFIASLRSLTPDGGSIALLDVQVMKIFPIGFVETDQTGRSSRPFDQSAEDEAQRAWEERRTNEVGKWQIQFEKQLDRMKAAVDKLAHAVKDNSTNADASPSNEVESFLEEFEDAEFDLELLKSRRFTSSETAWLASALESKHNELYERREGEMERQLADVCPPRKVRNFRVVVIKDACTLRRPTERTAQLTIWDILSVAGDSLRTGQRYLLANVQPSQLASWRKGNDAADIYLSTRRDTKWTMVSGA